MINLLISFRCDISDIKKAMTDVDEIDGATLKNIIGVLIDIVESQCKDMDRIKEKQTESDNEYYILSERILELKRYSRKTCLIINSIDVDEDYSGLGNSLSLLNSRLQLNLVPADIAACHPLA